MTSTAMNQTTFNNTAKPAGKKKLKGTDVGIPVRKLGQTYDESFPTFWFKNNAYLTMLFSAFSANLPEGEAQFVHSVRLFQDKITDPVLKAQVRAFIGQEAHHSREHDDFNAAMVKRGFPLDRVENRLKGLIKIMKKRSARKQLAETVCAEHFTALMADYILSDNTGMLETIAEPLRTTWAWHAIEELEHKAVAFDVYDQLVADRGLLRRTMFEQTIFIMLLNTFNALHLMTKTGEMGNRKMWREAFSMLGQMGRTMWSDYKDFYKRDYHPMQHDSQATLEKARKQFLTGKM
ncbi:metal-dependent hydrolase [Oleiphilus messinensis]|uniref:Metal-dependent hydrolase n=1 Tax=Oleiphilus messinensis TaxID=141451 RepID=A0A1Y0I288_9GAMM|nr:metal-dependent hydrolase [Oleiphilus messinensis]ARU54329.1 metal-dependent hydrolase [Oleiphilus messinensis]